MAIIYSYSNENELRRSDKLVGTATTLHNGKVRRLTKNFTIGELSDFINGGEITSLTLTTEGTSGAATLIDNILNIPIYEGAVWGDITGSVTDQTDLTEYLGLNYYPLSSNPAGYLTISTLPIPTLQQVTNATGSNLTSNAITVFNSAGVQQITLASDGVLNFKNIWESRVKLSSDLVISDLVNFFLPNLPAGDYTLATTGDITADTFQSVTDNGSTTTNALTVYNGIDIVGNYAFTVTQGNEGTYVAKNSVLTTDNSTGSFALLSSVGALVLGNPSNVQTAISANYLTAGNVPVGFELPNKPTGTYTIATTADIPSLTGYVPTARTLTINGTTYDLTADRSWTIATGSGTVTSVAALTLGTSGTDLTSTVTDGTTTPVITLNVPTASAANRGALSSTDWSLFNGKQDALLLAYTVMANNTNASANGTSQTFKSIANQTYTGTPVWTGTTAPSGATTNSYSWNQIGNLVTLRINLVYAVGGTLITAVTIPLPTDCPSPYVASGGTPSTNRVIAVGSGIMQTNFSVSTVSTYVLLKTNSTNTGFDIIAQRTGANYQMATVLVTYLTT